MAIFRKPQKQVRIQRVQRKIWKTRHKDRDENRPTRHHKIFYRRSRFHRLHRSRFEAAINEQENQWKRGGSHVALPATIAVVAVSTKTRRAGLNLKWVGALQKAKNQRWRRQNSGPIKPSRRTIGDDEVACAGWKAPDLEDENAS